MLGQILIGITVILLILWFAKFIIIDMIIIPIYEWFQPSVLEGLGEDEYGFYLDREHNNPPENSDSPEP